MKSWLLVLPEGLVGLAALACLFGGRVRGVQAAWLPWVSAALVLAALVVELVYGAAVTSLLGGGFSQDRFALFAKAALLLTALVLAVAADWESRRPVELGLTLLACLGGLVVASAGDLVALWAGLQLAVLASLAALAIGDPGAARRLLPVAGGLGALVAVGMALVAAHAGTSVLLSLSTVLVQPLALPLAIALLLVVGALLAQLASGPWLGPLAAGAAGLALLRFVGATSGLASAWTVLLPALAALALLVAALGSLSGGPARRVSRETGPDDAVSATVSRETRGWRILGWAGLLQLGWLAGALAAGSQLAIGSGLFLFGAYLLASAAGPLVLGPTPHGLAGLALRSPARAAGFAVCLLSLAGVPPLAGFFGELAVAGQLARAGLFWLVLVGFLSTALVSFAVLRDLRLVFLASPGEQVVAEVRGRLATGGAAAVAVLLVAYVFFANPISGLAVQGAAALGLR